MLKFFRFPLFFCCYLPSLIFGLSLSDLTLEEKVGQLLVVHFHGQEANEEARQLIQDLHVGGFIYYHWANGLNNPKQVQNLSEGLLRLAKETPHAIPLLIAIDQEGGRVVRLKEGFTVFPGNYALGQTGKWQWGEESAWMVGQELKAVRISLNLAPVVDVYTQPANPIIGIRSFSSDPMQVVKWGHLTLNGFKKAGVAAALKHFPGHGDVQVDSHEALPILNKKREVLDQVELYPFRMLASEADVMMTAHLFVPALDPEQCITFSKKAVNELLREEFNFQGVIITDSLAMQGALSQCSSLEEAVLRSIEAGHDLVLLGGKQLLASQSGLEFQIDDVKRVHRFLIEAVKLGKLSEQRIDESVARVLALKEKYQLFDCVSLSPTRIKTHVKTEAHCQRAREIAQSALSIVNGQDVIPIAMDDSSCVVVAPESLREELMQTSWSLLKIIYFKELNPDASAIEEAISDIGEKSKKVFYFSSNGWQFSSQHKLFLEIKNRFSMTVAIVVRDPLDIDHLTSADVVLCTFSPVAYSLQAAFDCLMVK